MTFTRVDVSFDSQAGAILVCKQGAGVDFSEEDAKRILTEKGNQIRRGPVRREKRRQAGAAT